MRKRVVLRRIQSFRRTKKEVWKKRVLRTLKRVNATAIHTLINPTDYATAIINSLCCTYALVIN
jgi:hypothetical protein